MNGNTESIKYGTAHEVPAARRAVIYGRTAHSPSGSSDADRASISRQQAACERKAHELGAVVERQFFDCGRSGNSANRPGLRAMLDRLRANDVDYVVVEERSRLARTPLVDLEILRMIEDAGAVLLCAIESNSEAPRLRIKLAESEEGIR